MSIFLKFLQRALLKYPKHKIQAKFQLTPNIPDNTRSDFICKGLTY
jgi:hypothetical protein